MANLTLARSEIVEISKVTDELIKRSSHEKHWFSNIERIPVACPSAYLSSP